MPRLLILLILPLFNSCTLFEEDQFACEYKYEFPDGNRYSCLNSTIDSCGKSDNVVVHEGKKCQDLGYNYKVEDLESTFRASEDGRTPGSEGAYANDPIGSEGLANCTDEYEGPLFDVQVDIQCQAAWSYACAGNAEAVEVSCNIYKGFQESNPNIPDCPYCD